MEGPERNNSIKKEEKEENDQDKLKTNKKVLANEIKYK